MTVESMTLSSHFAKLEKKDVLTVTTTVVDSNILPNASLDNLWADDDGDGMSDHADALRANAVSHAILYDLNEDSDYYVGYAGSRISGATLADWGASENNADAKMRDGFVFDDATGLIYVPKKYTEKNKKGELKPRPFHEPMKRAYASPALPFPPKDVFLSEDPCG